MKYIFSLLIASVSCLGANATSLFPFFVDIAPSYEEGLPAEMANAGVKCGMYYGTKPDFILKTFSNVESFFKDTLPDDVMREEKKVGEYTLVKYYSENKSGDLMDTGTHVSAIYVLQLPGDSYQAVLCEEWR